MCLIVRQKFRPNDISMICYKLLAGSKYDNKLLTPFKGVRVEDGFISAYNPRFGTRANEDIQCMDYTTLEGGAIHCFTSVLDAIALKEIWTKNIQVWKVFGHGLVARGNFDVRHGYESVAFERVEFLEKVA